MRFMKLTQDLTICLNRVSSYEIIGNQSRGFGDAPNPRTGLSVMMENGVEHFVQHRSGSMGEIDAFKIKAELDKHLLAMA